MHFHENGVGMLIYSTKVQLFESRGFILRLPSEQPKLLRNLGKVLESIDKTNLLFYQHLFQQTQVKYVQSLIFAEIRCFPVWKCGIRYREQPLLQENCIGNGNVSVIVDIAHDDRIGYIYKGNPIFCCVGFCCASSFSIDCQNLRNRAT